jgi:hypothetical protein
MTTAYTMRDLNSQVGERVIISAAPAGAWWTTEYAVTPWVGAGYGKPLKQDIPVGEYVIVGKTPDSDEDGAGATYVLRAA